MASRYEQLIYNTRDMADKDRMELYAEVFTKAVAVRERYASAGQREAVRIRIAELDSLTKTSSSLANTMAALAETQGRDNRTVVDALTSTRNAIINANVDLQERATTANNMAVAEFKQALARGDGADAIMQLTKVFNTTDAQSVGFTDLSLQGTLLELRRELFGSDPDGVGNASDMKMTAWAQQSRLPESVVNFMHDMEARAATQEHQRNTGMRELDALRGQVDAKLAAAATMPEGQAHTLVQGAAQEWSAAVNTAQEALKGGASDIAIAASRDSLEKDQEQIQELDETITTLQELLLSAKSPQSEREKAAQIITNPDFREWAAQYGFELGRAEYDSKGKLVAYAPGPDDGRALVTAHWQQTHKKPFRKPKTNDLVEVTRTRVAPDAADYAVADGPLAGQYLFRDAPGGPVPVHPETEAETLAAARVAAEGAVLSGVQAAADPADGTVWFQQADRLAALHPSGAWLDLAEQPPEKQQQVLAALASYNLDWAPLEWNPQGPLPAHVKDNAAPVAWQDLTHVMSQPAQSHAARTDAFQLLEPADVDARKADALRKHLRASNLILQADPPKTTEVVRGQRTADLWGRPKGQIGVMTEQGYQTFDPEDGVDMQMTYLGEAGKLQPKGVSQVLGEASGGRAEAMAQEKADRTSRATATSRPAPEAAATAMPTEGTKAWQQDKKPNVDRGAAVAEGSTVTAVPPALPKVDAPKTTAQAEDDAQFNGELQRKALQKALQTQQRNTWTAKPAAAPATPAAPATHSSAHVPLGVVPGVSTREEALQKALRNSQQNALQNTPAPRTGGL